MVCSVCGQDYGLTHNCPGIAPQADIEEPTPTRLRFAPISYFTQGWNIIFWDDAAIHRASRDPNALPYGIVFWAIGAASPLLTSFALLASRGFPIGSLQLRGLAFLLAFMALWDFLRFSICHLVAKHLLGGHGRLLPLFRALLLGSVVTWLLIIPILGLFLAGIGLTILIMVVFEELEGISRMQAFVLSLVVNFVFIAVLLSFGPI
jgi:hypothetical protein